MAYLVKISKLDDTYISNIIGDENLVGRGYTKVSIFTYVFAMIVRLFHELTNRHCRGSE